MQKKKKKKMISQFFGKIPKHDVIFVIKYYFQKQKFYLLLKILIPGATKHFARLHNLLFLPFK